MSFSVVNSTAGRNLIYKKVRVTQSEDNEPKNSIYANQKQWKFVISAPKQNAERLCNPNPCARHANLTFVLHIFGTYQNIYADKIM